MFLKQYKLWASTVQKYCELALDHCLLQNGGLFLVKSITCVLIILTNYTGYAG